jgi:hypothetical protein
LDRLSPAQKKTLLFDRIPTRHVPEVEAGLVEAFNHALLLRQINPKLSDERKAHVAAFAFMNNFFHRLPEGDLRERVERLRKGLNLDDKVRAKLDLEHDVVFPAIDKAVEETDFDLGKWQRNKAKVIESKKTVPLVATHFSLWPVFVAALNYVDSPAHLHN